MHKTFLAALLMGTAVWAGDSVWTEPAEPTTADSVVFHLFNENLCCCTQYHNVSLSVVDTTIMLGFEADARRCSVCYCIVAGSWVEFTSAPLAAGTYGVYKAQSMYCPPGEDCPAVVIAPERVGELTVTGSTAAQGNIASRRAHTVMQRHRPGATYTLRGERIHAGQGIPRGAGVVVTARGDGAVVAPMLHDTYVRNAR
jgi:hypothetical protein